ncbi:tRNA (adenosine(37)-N6)-threonylcarbamoyltransferase complex ATPase subunit type 1 TsaE [Candidatus Vampirococcus lugosii]|uniref:tRNA threonylcarbamoyladenosine biosynthesis protein TsaE n=1 Tax=Candidatus Vampirococcus lugosii TaxID=2789015 RepID=A0ABS5QLX8_9BACT|nr:tRNA (adenosine(37)-N6)-threonylcarbamoyltransferase complex ATPase subunit type 1 TsaE [Candidatus Vampirococcus lugosii]MBS8122206.1 ATP/GTP hydrolase [Candidatus Vampirococcus lugosii]
MIIKSSEDMQIFAEKIAQKGYKKILLNGELGVGKTNFVKGFAKGIGISENIIQSPTYTYINEYKKLLHIDMYRLESIEQIYEMGIFDKIDEYEYICIEWPKFIKEYISKEYLNIYIEKLSKDERELIY